MARDTRSGSLTPRPMGPLIHQVILTALYTLTVVTTVLVWSRGSDYYRLPSTLRPHNDMHAVLKPGGLVGHGLGIAGSALLILLLVYPARKHLAFMRDWGHIRYFLDYHIWMGITAPILIVLHATFKSGGIVAVAFWSVIGVALSGIVGRYIYLQIPRRFTGEELNSRELQSLLGGLDERLESTSEHTDEVRRGLRLLANQRASSDGSLLREFFRAAWSDLLMPMTMRRVNRVLARVTEMPSSERRTIQKLVHRQLVLSRRIAFLGVSQRILTYWHVAHRPFAVVMFIIMGVHVAVAVVFGYRWIW